MRWYLKRDPPQSAILNMAIDDALLELYAKRKEVAPLLRLYSWAEASVSIGRNQSLPESVAIWSSKNPRHQWVRRPSGGRAVFHYQERTFSVIARLGAPPFMGSVSQSYELVQTIVENALIRLNVEPVFEMRYKSASIRSAEACFHNIENHEPSAGSNRSPEKLVGIAQVRRKRAVLLQGSIPLGTVKAQAQFFDEGDFQPGRCEPRWEIEAVDRAWIQAFEALLGVTWQPFQEDRSFHEALLEQESKHQDPRWLRRVKASI